MDKFLDYDFLGSIYKNTESSELEECFDSICKQTLRPKSVILVLDGFIPKDLKNIIEKYSKLLPLKTIPLNKNEGLGIALRKGLQKCQSQVILRFDTDDFNLPSRALNQIKYMEEGDFDITSTYIYEFEENINSIERIKRVPLDNQKIRNSIYYRNPFNHPSVGFKRKSILKLDGGYRDVPYYEDYDLWIRAIFNRLKIKVQ